jgi:hypothetical protein
MVEEVGELFGGAAGSRCCLGRLGPFDKMRREIAPGQRREQVGRFILGCFAEKAMCQGCRRARARCPDTAGGACGTRLWEHTLVAPHCLRPPARADGPRPADLWATARAARLILLPATC